MTPERPAIEVLPPACSRARGKTVVVSAVIGLVIAGFSTPAKAVPVNPERPFAATTCPAAQDRLHEALTGSPLISKGENADILRHVRSRTEALCGKSTVQELITQFHKTHKPQTD